MKDKKSYQAKDGWIHCKLNIVPGTELTQDQVVKIITMRDPEDYEVPVFKHYKTVIRIVLRRNVKTIVLSKRFL